MALILRRPVSSALFLFISADPDAHVGKHVRAAESRREAPAKRASPRGVNAWPAVGARIRRMSTENAGLRPASARHLSRIRRVK